MLLERLPVFSAYGEAVADDPDVAAQVVDLPQRRYRPAVREFTPEVALMNHMVDRLTEVTVGIAALGGAKPRRPEQLPRPETAVDRLRRELDRAQLQSLLDDVDAAQERWAAEHPEHQPDDDTRR